VQAIFRGLRLGNALKEDSWSVACIVDDRVTVVPFLLRNTPCGERGLPTVEPIRGRLLDVAKRLCPERAERLRFAASIVS
jgi:hypothetical protein